MAKTHQVEQGEHISGIAARHGFADWHVIWDDPANADLKKKRDPHVLFPGDGPVIPDRLEKDEAGRTTAVHTFQVDLPPLFLRLKVLDWDGIPVKDANCHLGLESFTLDAIRTSTKGFLEHEIQRLARKAELTAFDPIKKPSGTLPFAQIRFDLRIGHLDPETTFSGQQARLNNLGYFAGFSNNDIAQFRWAVEEFQRDHLFPSGVKAVPKIEPASDDTNATTGIQDVATRNKLKVVHGI